MRLLSGVAKRLLAAVVVMVGAATLAFGALHLIPGDQVSILLGPNSAASPEVRAQIRSDYGFDRPLVVQYAQYLSNVVRGRLGESYQQNQPVSALIGGQVWPTLQLAAAALGLALVIAAVSAVATAGRRPAWRSLASAWELVAVSTPAFWTGLLLLTAFSFQLHVFPVAGAQDLRSLVLPALALALSLAGVLGQVLREGLETALRQPFATTARARGLSQLAVTTRHAFRHAAVPLLTLAGWLTGTLVGGVVAVETVFGRPGIGALILLAVSTKDMPVVMGIVLLCGLIFVVTSLLVDLLAVVVDPRLRAEAVAV
ncbi:ABC transporter permease [Frankia canadensis]|uniref:ABC transporter permease n=1 Tax=Frankia canadensis TaxID=1836972 RepID=UPI00311AB6E3